MTVGELRAALDGAPDDLPVFIDTANGPVSGGQVGPARQAAVRPRQDRGHDGATRSDLWWSDAPDEALIIDGYTEEHRG